MNPCRPNGSCAYVCRQCTGEARTGRVLRRKPRRAIMSRFFCLLRKIRICLLSEKQYYRISRSPRAIQTQQAEFSTKNPAAAWRIRGYCRWGGFCIRESMATYRAQSRLRSRKQSADFPFVRRSLEDGLIGGIFCQPQKFWGKCRRGLRFRRICRLRWPCTLSFLALCL